MNDNNVCNNNKIVMKKEGLFATIKPYKLYAIICYNEYKLYNNSP